MTDDLRQILDRPTRIRAEIRKLICKLEEMEWIPAHSVRCGVIETNFKESYVERYVLKRNAILNRIHDLQIEFIGADELITEMTEGLDSSHRCIIVRHFIAGQSWRQIAADKGLSERTVYNMRKESITELESVLDALKATGGKLTS